MAQLLGLKIGLTYDDVNKCSSARATCIMNREAMWGFFFLLINFIYICEVVYRTWWIYFFVLNSMSKIGNLCCAWRHFTLINLSRNAISPLVKKYSLKGIRGKILKFMKTMKYYIHIKYYCSVVVAFVA